MKKQIISASMLVVGFLVGATALTAVAEWSGPGAGCTPPNCNVAAPINVGTIEQSRIGLLGLRDLVVKGLTVTTEEGTTTTNTTVGTGGIAGKVLTAIDSNGTVGWRSASGGGSANIQTGTYLNALTQCTGKEINASTTINFSPAFSGSLPVVTTSFKWNQDSGNGGPRIWVTNVTLSSFRLHYVAPDVQCSPFSEIGIMWMATQ